VTVARSPQARHQRRTGGRAPPSPPTSTAPGALRGQWTLRGSDQPAWCTVIVTASSPSTSSLRKVMCGS